MAAAAASNVASSTSHRRLLHFLSGYASCAPRAPTSLPLPRRRLRGRRSLVTSVFPSDDLLEVIPVRSSVGSVDNPAVAQASAEQTDDADSGAAAAAAVPQIDMGGLALPGGGAVGGGVGGGVGASFSSADVDRTVDRGINAAMVLVAGTFAITKLLTIDHDYWHGWTIYEIVRYAPQHNWTAYEEALKTNPVFAKMMISGVVYSLGDWVAQCYEGKPLFEFDRARMLRSGAVGFALHGSLSHYYYHFCEALFPFQDWWVVPVKVLFDQTAWSALWNSIYYVVVAILRLESPLNVINELKATFWPMLTAGWKLWPFAHLITYGLIPVEQRLLWVDCVELIWVTILSTYSNEKSEARLSEGGTTSQSPTSGSQDDTK